MALRGRDIFNKYKPILLFLSKVVKVLPLKLRIKLFVYCRNKKGLIGIGKRYILLKSIAKKLLIKSKSSKKINVFLKFLERATAIK